MFQNYFLLAWRHILKNRGYSAINIVGLSIGMAIALVIGLWITDELSFATCVRSHGDRSLAAWKNATDAAEL